MLNRDFFCQICLKEQVLWIWWTSWSYASIFWLELKLCFWFRFSTGFTSVHGERPSTEYAKLRKESLESEFGHALGTYSSKNVSMFLRFGPFLAFYRAAIISFHVLKLAVWQFFVHDIKKRSVKVTCTQVLCCFSFFSHLYLLLFFCCFVRWVLLYSIFYLDSQFLEESVKHFIDHDNYPWNFRIQSWNISWSTSNILCLTP